ncbi:hypothetical protein PHYPSEUDO_003298 [Phytophthora pseudosyringae]|uniref:Uncharacterized protein n=1 Tax=Phytophthora pseudosyringae TaxID=221518 RepID=A0A8T1VR30_9STRA|nr:hypothetical protein PHYPSEUDO_003298 [Phytophthora pseudosyringae]
MTRRPTSRKPRGTMAHAAEHPASASADASPPDPVADTRPTCDEMATPEASEAVGDSTSTPAQKGNVPVPKIDLLRSLAEVAHASEPDTSDADDHSGAEEGDRANRDE